MSVNLLTNDNPPKTWSDIYINRLTVYTDAAIQGNLSVTGDLVLDDVTADDVIVDSIQFSNPAITENGALNYYESSQPSSIVLTVGGPIPTASVNCKAIRIGKLIQIQVPSFTAIGNGSSAQLQSTNTIPAKWRPSASVTVLCDNKDFNSGATNEVGRAVINASGVLTIEKNLVTANFVGGTNSGGLIAGVTFSYILD